MGCSERYRSIFDVTSDALMLLDEQSFFDCNSATLSLFGCQSKADFCGLHPSQLSPPEQADGRDSMSAAKERIQMAMEEGYCRFEWEHIRYNTGVCFPAEVTLTCMQLEGRTVLLASVRDISESKESELRMQEIRDQLQHAERLRVVGELAGGIAHDFNNQLAGIQGFAEVICWKNNNSEINDYAHKILKATQRSADMISKLLAFAKKGVQITEVFDLEPLVYESIELGLQYTDCRICNSDVEQGPFYVTGDVVQIQNVILNVIKNAVDAMDGHGAIEVHIETMHFDQPNHCSSHILAAGQYTAVSITDSGEGIRDELLHHIFEPFFTSKSDGTGMGLAAAYGTMENHRGAIDVKSCVGQGSVFTLYFPQAEAPLLDKQEKPMNVRIESLEKNRRRILVIDDEDMVREAHAGLLQALGYDTVMASGGREACELYQQQTFDVVLLDMKMPDMDGMETYYALRAIDSRAKVIIVSGYSNESRMQQLLRDGVVGFLFKPMDGHTVLELIQSLFK